MKGLINTCRWFSRQMFETGLFLNKDRLGGRRHPKAQGSGSTGKSIRKTRTRDPVYLELVFSSGDESEVVPLWYECEELTRCASRFIKSWEASVNMGSLEQRLCQESNSMLPRYPVFPPVRSVGNPGRTTVQVLHRLAQRAQRSVLRTSTCRLMPQQSFNDVTCISSSNSSVQEQHKPHHIAAETLVPFSTFFF
jgi:hypothetical protein